MQQSYLDPQDDLTRMQQHLQAHGFFEGCTVILDSFTGFTVQECSVLSEILKQAKDVYVTLCTDRLDDPENGMGLFSAVRKTASKLLHLAREAGVPVAKPVILSPGKTVHFTGSCSGGGDAFAGETPDPNERRRMS